MKPLLLALLAASAAIASEVTVTLTGVNGATVDGFYASPYTATIEGVPYEVWCDDLLDTVAIGQSWQATVGSVGMFPAADYPVLDALALIDTPAIYAADQAGMWTLTDPGFTSVTAESNALLLAAESNPYTGSAFDVVTPIAGEPGQEFIVDAVPVAPEPPEWAMLVIGVGLFAFRRRRN